MESIVNHIYRIIEVSARSEHDTNFLIELEPTCTGVSEAYAKLRRAGFAFVPLGDLSANILNTGSIQFVYKENDKVVLRLDRLQF